MNDTKTKKGGRPKGSKNAPVAYTRVDTGRCPRCGSTERDPYYQRMEQEYNGTEPDGQPFTHIVRRWTKCAECRQTRIETTHENRRP